MKLKAVFVLHVEPKGYANLCSGSSFLPQNRRSNCLMPGKLYLSPKIAC